MLGDGRLCQIIDGRAVIVGATNGPLNLPMAAMNEHVFGGGPFQQHANGALKTPEPVSAPPFFDQLPVARQIQMLEEQKAQLEKELREHNRQEVLDREKGRDRHDVDRRSYVNKRVSLTNQIDSVRRHASRLKDQSSQTSSQYPAYAMHPMYFGANMAPLTGYFPQMQYGSHPMMMGAPFIMGADSFGGADFNEGKDAQLGVQYPAFASKFQPFAPEFIPSTRRQQEASQSQLQERSANVAAGAEPTVYSRGDKIHERVTSRTAAPFTLDGSSLQPRLSHAIEIKKPVEKKAASAETTIVVQQPDQARKAHDANKDATNVKSSPAAHHKTPLRASDVGVSQDSLSTDDFFPHSALQHSARDWSRDAQALSSTELAGWLRKEGDARVPAIHETPVKPLSGFHFDEDSPREDRTVLHNLNLRAAAMDDVTNKFDEALDLADDKGTDYKQGYAAGSKLESAPANGSANFLNGYRDGLLAASRQIQARGSPAANMDSALPVPANTAINTPLHHSEAGPSDDHIKDDPSALPNQGRSSIEGMISQPGKKADHLLTGSPVSHRGQSQNDRPTSGGGHRIFSAPKVTSSIAHTNSHANGRFVCQLDGSGEDQDVPSIETAALDRSKKEASSRENKGKQKSPGSPIKRASSAATSAVRRMLGEEPKHVNKDEAAESKKAAEGATEPVKSNKDVLLEALSTSRLHKGENPDHMNPAEKAKWNAKWNRRFNELKKSENEFIDRYYREHGPP